MYDERFGKSDEAFGAGTTDDSSLAGWFRNLVLHPVRPSGDYFDRLRADVEASAPVCTACA